MKQEMWKKIPGFEGVFYASNTGQIKRKKLKVSCKSRNGNDFSYILPKKFYNKKSLDSKGYKTIHIKGKLHRVHRLIALTWIKNTKNKPNINHKNGIKTDNHIKNLEWCTTKENGQHASKLGLIKKGQDHAHAKLTAEKVLDIRYRHKIGQSQREIAKLYNIGYKAINKIVLKQRWKHI